MADIELVIKIPEEEYALCKKQWDTECLDALMIAVKYGIPLPKGHGRLIDADRLKIDNPLHLSLDVPYVTEYTVEGIIDNAPTIIEADKESEEI